MPLISLLLLTLLASACSDSSSPDSGEETDGPSKFTITSVDQDSVYWGEWVTVLFSNLEGDSIRLFLHTQPTTIDSFWRDDSGSGGIRFQVPIMASSGQIRLFEQDTILAKGEASLIVLSKLRSEFKSRANGFVPAKGYAGDLLIVNGSDIPMRWRDIGITVGDVPLRIESWDSIRIFARVTPEAQTGIVRVRLFDKITTLSTFRKLEHEDTLLPNGRLSRITLLTHDLKGSTMHFNFWGQDTVQQKFSTIADVNTNTSSLTVQQTPHPDSIIFEGEQTSSAITKKIEVRLKSEPESRVSGVIRFSYVDHATNDKARQSVELQVKNMRWMQDQGAFVLYANSFEVTDQLTGFYYLNSDGFNDLLTETVTYEGGSSESWINIVLSP